MTTSITAGTDKTLAKPFQRKELVSLIAMLKPRWKLDT